MSIVANIEANKRYQDWLGSIDDPDTINELLNLSEADIVERFSKYLDFGTAGMRGEIGVGTNRINTFIIRSATQGLANYIKHYGKKAI